MDRGAGLLRKCGELVGLPRRNSDAETVARKEPRQGRAEARAGADDQRRAVFGLFHSTASLLENPRRYTLNPKGGKDFPMETVATAGRIDVISDVICPWCYIGKRQLERALDILEKHRLRFTVAWHPFQLNPDMPAEGVDRQQYRIAKFGSLERSKQMDQRITETAATVGIEFHLEKLTRTPNTLDAHRLIRFAGQKGAQDEVVEALFY